MAGSALAATLEELVRRLDVELEVKTARVWDGPWASLQDAGRLSVAIPAALVSLNALDVSHRARRRFRPGQLRAATAGNPAAEFPAPGQGAPAADPATSTALEVHAHVGLAVTLLAADPKASERAAHVAHLAEAAVAVLVGYALVDIRGTNLYTRSLYQKGIGAFMLAGARDVELGPGPPARSPPERVDLVDAAGVRETVWVRGAA